MPNNKKIKKFKQTKEVVKYFLKYVNGKTLDIGAGSAKYRQIIKERASEYPVPQNNIVLTSLSGLNCYLGVNYVRSTVFIKIS